jgi:hypothetical protein
MIPLGGDWISEKRGVWRLIADRALRQESGRIRVKNISLDSQNCLIIFKLFFLLYIQLSSSS